MPPRSGNTSAALTRPLPESGPMLFTVALPEWEAEADMPVQTCRRENDPEYALIGPHFTLTFGAPVDEAPFIEHVRAIARQASAVQFALRRALVQTGATGLSHVFLVPDEVAADTLMALHDRLYGGLLAAWLSRDETFLPHVTVAAFDRPQPAQALADRWNAQPFALAGHIRALTVGRLANQRFDVLAQWPLEWRA